MTLDLDAANRAPMAVGSAVGFRSWALCRVMRPVDTWRRSGLRGDRDPPVDCWARGAAVTRAESDGRDARHARLELEIRVAIAAWSTDGALWRAQESSDAYLTRMRASGHRTATPTNFVRGIYKVRAGR